MKYLQLFENFDSSDIIDDINMILLELSNSSSFLIQSSIENFGKSILIYDLDIKEDKYDADDAETANFRLKDIGYRILQISRTSIERSFFPTL